MKRVLMLALVVMSFCFSQAYAKGPSYGGGKHTASHGGKYSGGKGSSHKGGTYKNTKTANQYGRHK